MELSDTSRVAQEQHERLLSAFEADKKARSIAVPTADNEVKARLRSLAEPICLFGEQAVDRRDRLRSLLANGAVADDANRVSRRIQGGSSLLCVPLLFLFPP